VQTVEHVRVIPNALSIQLSNEEIDEIQNAAPFNPLFPNTFLFDGKNYSTRLNAADQTNYQMATWINAPAKKPLYLPRS
jgi:hypothetical protein